jgi:hypothetical protein
MTNVMGSGTGGPSNQLSTSSGPASCVLGACHLLMANQSQLDPVLGRQPDTLVGDQGALGAVAVPVEDLKIPLVTNHDPRRDRDNVVNLKLVAGKYRSPTALPGAYPSLCISETPNEIRPVRLIQRATLLEGMLSAGVASDDGILNAPSSPIPTRTPRAVSVLLLSSQASSPVSDMTTSIVLSTAFRASLAHPGFVIVPDGFCADCTPKSP